MKKNLVYLILILNYCFSFELKQVLSEYNIFEGNPKLLIPTEDYLPYDHIKCNTYVRAQIFILQKYLAANVYHNYTICFL